MEKLTACPVCDYGKIKRSIIFGTLTYFKCGRCGVQFLNPRMDDAETDEYYKGQYRINCPVNTQDIISQRERARTQVLLLRDFLAGGRALEIGCSAGYLLRELQQYDYDVVGVDPDNGRIPAQDHIKVYDNVTAVPVAPYDLICLSHSLEHMNHPRQVLEALKAYTRPGTRIMIEVPNTPQNAGAYKVHHPIAFDNPSLTWLMDAVGCAPLIELTHGLGSTRQFYLLGLYEVQNRGIAI